MRSPVTECISHFPVHTYYGIVSKSRVREITLGHWLVVRIREVSDPGQCIWIHANRESFDERRTCFVLVFSFCSFLKVETFNLELQFGRIDLFSSEDAIFRRQNH